MDNIIQIIEDNEEFNDSKKGKDSSIADPMYIERIARKDEEQIFENKDAYNEFIRKQKLTMYLPCVLAIGLVLSIAMYATYLFVLQSQNNSTQTYFSEMNFQSRVIGTLAKQ